MYKHEASASPPRPMNRIKRYLAKGPLSPTSVDKIIQHIFYSWGYVWDLKNGRYIRNLSK